MDGKHVVILKPAKSGSTYLNYKQTFSMVLMAVADAHYKFLYVNVGGQGRISDGGVFAKCKLAEAMEKNTLNFPEPSTLPNAASAVLVPYLVVADDAFPLRPNIMKPFPRRQLSEKERIYNYRLSRACRVVENAFGILANKFRVFKSPIALKQSTVRSIVLATVCLHNFLCEKQLASSNAAADEEDDLDELENSCENSGLQDISAAFGTGRASTDAKVVRNTLVEYFFGAGAVDWQRKYAGLE